MLAVLYHVLYDKRNYYKFGLKTLLVRAANQKRLFFALLSLSFRIHAPIRDAPPSMVSLYGAKKQPFPATRELLPDRRDIYIRSQKNVEICDEL